MQRITESQKRNIEQLLSGWVLRDEPDGLLMRRFIVPNRRRKNRASYLTRRLRPETVIILIKRGLLVFYNSADDPKRLVPAINREQLNKIKIRQKTGKGKYQR